MAHDPGLILLVGNGLSIAVNESLRLETLTRDFLNARTPDDRHDLERLVAGTTSGDPAENFESIVAALESAEEVVSSFMGLASRVAQPQLNEAADLLDEHGVPALIRRLYYAYCAEVLQAIGTLTRETLPGPLAHFGEWVRDAHLNHRRTSFFTLNYDLLLDRMLVADNVLNLRPALTDFFSGLPERRLDVQLVPGQPPTIGYMFYPEDPPPGRPIHLHHLHGCLTHLRDRRGTVIKISAESARDLNVYEYLATAPDCPWTPSVILGSRKVEKSRDWPFAFAFLRLEQDIRAARTVVIAGYSFRDEAVNLRLETASTVDRRWIVITRKSDDAAREQFKAKVKEVMPGADPEFVFDGFEADLPDVT
jgi:hypothetical protein